EHKNLLNHSSGPTRGVQLSDHKLRYPRRKSKGVRILSNDHLLLRGAFPGNFHDAVLGRNRAA
ncbi:MAG: hypothetical protein MO846_09770, partial [Candidatus Devosia symbiotica]|nr:hypothetical protein [Candidatus Devosia symbiotica]